MSKPDRVYYSIPTTKRLLQFAAQSSAAGICRTALQIPTDCPPIISSFHSHFQIEVAHIPGK
jgi:hypothetical protein